MTVRRPREIRLPPSSLAVSLRLDSDVMVGARGGDGLHLLKLG